MLLHIPKVISESELQNIRSIITDANWVDGKVTAGTQSEQVKNNLQLEENSEAANKAREIVLQALSRNALFFSAVLPKKIYPPLFNQYKTGMSFGNHIDNAVRTHRSSAVHVRTDISSTLFLSDPESYDGGELVIEDTFGQQSIKLPAGDMVVYPGTSLHHVNEISKGSRFSCFFWTQSMIREDEKRTLLLDMDSAITSLRNSIGDNEAITRLTGNYHNLIRMWSDV
ncbi:MAG: 2OG-Fe(II) oxygenase [Pseudomonadota bacterium]|jgi:PKHD-type hydroxylase